MWVLPGLLNEDQGYFEACLRDSLTNESNKNNVETALTKLDKLLKEWVREEAGTIGQNEDVEVKLYTFGSYRLGVQTPGGDVDALVVGPHHVHRGLFFTSFYAKLQQCEEVSKLTAIPESYVPVIKCVYQGVPFDIVYAQVNLVPNFDIFDDINLKSIDPKSVLSLNGCRVAEAILQLVPDVPKFRICLCFIKLWAKDRGIYSSAFGYLPGISWAILVARVCQLYQTVPALRLIQNFFYFYAYMHCWPQPVLLTPPYYIENLGLEVWNPQFNANHGFDVMPIITPAYPFMNSSYNVSQHTLSVIQNEFMRAYSLFLNSSNDIWDKLRAPSEFFEEYSHYIHLTASGSSKEELHGWLGWVRSKIRCLTNDLAMHCQSTRFCHGSRFRPYLENESRFRPYPETFYHCTEKLKHCASYFIGLNLHKNNPPMEEIFFSINRFKSIVISWYNRKERMDLEAKIILSSDLPDYTRRTSDNEVLDHKDHSDEDFPSKKSQDAQRLETHEKHSSKLAPLTDELKTLKVDESTPLPQHTVQEAVVNYSPPSELLRQDVPTAGKKKMSPVWKVKQDTPPHTPHVTCPGPSCYRCHSQVSVGCQVPVSGQAA